MNHDTVDYIVRKLPESLRMSLETHCTMRGPVSPEAISELLSRAITAIDHALMSDFIAQFPGGERALAGASQAQIKRMIHDEEGGGRRYTAVARVLGGTTALLTLLHEDTDSLWVANLGDSCAGKHRIKPCIHYPALEAC